MKIDFQIIPHKKHRYPTVGDYFFVRKVLNFRVSKMSDARYAILVFLHELIEFFMCRQAGVKMNDIDKFDTEYEAGRDKITHQSHSLRGAVYNGLVIHETQTKAPCGCAYREEPGDDPHAPYFMQHQTATKCERLIAKALGVNWGEYEREVESL